ncbi:hypothetical protein [Bacteroides acidifaciens]|uniref:hypothetical protein n=1 Tax=Bacteroides acidifaciens TaxID=85831 RepID=UPI00263A5D1B|nr:hypothetical protein [Bacteroides acidifaciens]
MGMLSHLFRNAIGTKDTAMQEAVFDTAYSTGFLALDFLNGTMVTVKNSFQYYSVGITDGTSVTLIGRPGCGKTSIALQMGANIIRPFPKAAMFYDDIEGGSNGTRRQVLTNFDADEINERVIYRNAGITAENFFNRICTICDLKLSNREEYEYDTGLLDPRGNKIYKFEPTVYILDSLAMLSPEKLTEEEELSGQMSATSMARTNTSIYKRIVPKLKAANIILIVINHINDKVEINPFAKTAAQVGYLKPGETLPGGRAAIYLANNMFRLDDSTKIKESEGFGVYGKIVDLTIVKSRTNAGGRSIPLVFDSFSGFDPDLSLLVFLKSVGEVNSKGAFMSINGYPEMKFTQKGFKERLYQDAAFQRAFMDACTAKLKELVRVDQEAEAKHKVNSYEFTSSLLNDLIAA